MSCTGECFLARRIGEVDHCICSTLLSQPPPPYSERPTSLSMQIDLRLRAPFNTSELAIPQDDTLMTVMGNYNLILATPEDYQLVYILKDLHIYQGNRRAVYYGLARLDNTVIEGVFYHHYWFVIDAFAVYNPPSLFNPTCQLFIPFQDDFIERIRWCLYRPFLPITFSYISLHRAMPQTFPPEWNDFVWAEHLRITRSVHISP